MNARGVVGLVLSLIVLTASAIAGETESIGSLGATVDVPDKWSRKLFNDDLGDDQFKRSGFFSNGWLTIVELKDVFDTKADFSEYVRDFVRGTGAADYDLPTFTRRRGVGHMRVDVYAKKSGLDFTYSIHLVGRDGLAYLVMAWAAHSDVQIATGGAAEFAAGIRFPGEGSEWARSAEKTPRKLAWAGHEFSISYRPSVLHEEPDAGDGFLLLMTEADGFAVYLLGHEGRDTTVERLLDDATKVLSDEAVFNEVVARGDIEVAGRAGRELMLTTAGSQDFSAQIVAIPLGGQDFLEIRIIFRGPPRSRWKLRSSLLESIHVSESSWTDLLPETHAEDTGPTPSATVQALLASAKRLAELESTSCMWVLPDGLGFVMSSTRGVDVLAAGASESERRLVEDGWSFNRSAVFCGTVLFESSDGEVRTIQHGVGRRAGFQADWLMPGPGESLLLLRRDGPTDFVGFPMGSKQQGVLALVSRQRDGTESVVARLPGRSAMRAAPNGSGTHVLIASEGASSEPIHWSPWAGEVYLTRVALDGGEPALDIADWRSVTHIGVADDGWLVTGIPVGKPTGVYHLDSAGEAELLISGADAVGIHMADGQLTFTSSLDVDQSSGSWNTACAYRIPVEDALSLGAAFQPFDHSSLRSIVESVRSTLELPPDPLTTRATLDALMAQARIVARQEWGADLPSRPHAVDGLLNDLMNGPTPGADALLLMSGLLAECLLAEGARWVPGEAAPQNAYDPWSTREEFNVFAMSCVPREVVLSSLFREEGWWDPAQTIVAGANGRAILIGPSHAALSEAVVALAEADLDSLLSERSADAVTEFVMEHPGNAYLRDHVYAELVARNRIDDVRELAAPFARTDDALANDLRAWYAARLSSEPSSSEASGFVDGLLAAIRRFPDNMSLYVMLGQAFELLATEEGRDRAAAAYSEVVERESWGPNGTYAEEALERLGR